MNYLFYLFYSADKFKQDDRDILYNFFSNAGDITELENF